MADGGDIDIEPDIVILTYTTRGRRLHWLAHKELAQHEQDQVHTRWIEHLSVPNWEYHN